jgi:ketosteroid isomerase-like protein
MMRGFDMTHIELAKRFFSAAETDPGNFREVCAPNLEASQNGGPAMNLETLIEFGSSVKQVVSGFRYDNPIRSETKTGFVEEHDVVGTLPDGSELKLAVCVVAEVSDGKITRLREYLDTAAAAGLIAALA